MKQEETFEYNIINELKKVKGAISYDGECSIQVLLPTKDGKMLRVGTTDSDVALEEGIWFDYYEGLNNEISDSLNRLNPNFNITKQKVLNVLSNNGYSDDAVFDLLEKHL